VCAPTDADLEAVQFFHKQGFRPVEEEDFADVTARLAAHGIVEPTPSKLMFTSVENQLFVGQAREAEAQAQALGPELVGQRVEVYWSGENVWFPGHVAAYKAQERIHYVIYDDGESVWERLTAKDCKALGPGPARAQLDTTVCAICNGNGTAGPLYGPFDSNKRGDLHVHEHCIMFNSSVRLVGGALRGVGNAIASAKKASCKICRKKGASVTCAQHGCNAVYHYECCKSDTSCHFQNEQYEFYCPAHKPRPRRESARRAGQSAAGGLAAAAAVPSGPPQRLSPFGSASCEMLAPAARSSTRSPAAASSAAKLPTPAKAKAKAPAPARSSTQNNGTTGGWTPREDRCLAAIMEAAKPSSSRSASSRAAAGYSWSEIAAVVARSVDAACTRSENSCRHRWNKIAGVYKPTAAEKRRAQVLLEANAVDDDGGSGASTAGDSDESAADSVDSSGDAPYAVRECQQKVIVAGDDEGSDADNDVVEVVSVGADILILPEPKPGYGYARAHTGPSPRAASRAAGGGSAVESAEARGGRAAGGGSGTSSSTTSRVGSSSSGGSRKRGVPHPPAPIVRSPAATQPQRTRQVALQGKHVRRSGGTAGSETRLHEVGSGGNCRICRNGRGVCRRRGAPGHLEVDDPDTQKEDSDGDEGSEEEEDEETSDEEEEEEEDESASESSSEEEPEPPTTRRRSGRR
jgi:hypothetical protein